MEFLSSFSQLIKFYPPGYIGPSAAAVPYEILQYRSRITQPGKSRSLTEEEMNVPRMLVKIWEIGDILQYHHILQKLSDIRELSPPPTFLAYNDVFFTYNAIVRTGSVLAYLIPLTMRAPSVDVAQMTE